MACFENVATVCIIGCTRGLGKSIAEEFAAELKPHSTLIMIGRSAQKMEQTRAAVLERNPDIFVHMYCNFGCSQPVMEKFEEFLNSCKGNVSKAETLLVIHNAATLDPSRKSLTWQLRDASEDVMTNFVSAVAANNVIMTAFSRIRNKMVVNITSGFKIQTLSGCALYCANKSARETFFSCMVNDYPDMRVLSYAPGALDTEMISVVIKTACDQRFGNSVLLEPSESARKLIAILKADKFKSGEKVSYHDDL